MLSLVSALLVILTTGFWAFQGLFSSVIMLGETLLALMTAFSFYEPLANYWKDTMSPELSEPGFLFVIFFVTLIVLRVLSDKYIPGTLRVHQLVDRIGGGLFGLFTGLIMIGLLLICVQMLPVGRTTMGFERINSKTGRTNSIWLSPDGFTLGLLNMLSDDRFAWGDGSPRLEVAKPDLLVDLALRRAGTQVESRKLLPSDAIALLDVYRVPQIKERQIKHDGAAIVRDASKPAEKRDLGSSYLVCRLAIKTSAAEVDEGAAKGSVLFTPAQFRLAGPRPGSGSRTEVPHLYFACGMSDIYIPPPYDRGGGATPVKIDAESAAELVRMDPDTPLTLNIERDSELQDKDKNYVIDVVFEVPSDTFEPWYVEFKQGARCVIPVGKKIELRTAGGESGGAAAKPANETDESKQQKQPSDGGDQTSSGGDSEKKDEPAPPRTRPKRPSKPREPEQPAEKKGRVIIGAAERGRVSVANAITERTGVSDEFPVDLPKDNSRVQSMSRGEKFHDGHVVIELPDKTLTDSQRVLKFDVPDGKKMVQIGVSEMFSGSTFGGALEFARRALAEFYLETDDGDKYFAQGTYVEAMLNGKRVLELQYWYEPEVPERCIQNNERLTPNILKMNATYKAGYLFIVKPGVKLIRWHTSPRSAQDILIEVPK